MFRSLFLLFLIVPIIEIAFLIQVSEVIGGWPTIGLVVFTAFLGAKMVRQQGLRALVNAQQRSATGELPASELFDGVCILISGVLLLTPGIFTDVLGFALLSENVRSKLAASLQEKLVNNMQSPNSGFTFYSSSSFSQYQGSQQRDPFADRHDIKDKQSNTIEGEFERKD